MLVLFVAGLGVIVWRLLGLSPVVSDVDLNFEGEWPAVRLVTLVYTDGDEVLRKVSRLSPGPGNGWRDTPRLSPGTYEVEVTVVTDEGRREYVRTLEHARGTRSRIDLRY